MYMTAPQKMYETRMKRATEMGRLNSSSISKLEIAGVVGVSVCCWLSDSGGMGLFGSNSEGLLKVA